MGRGNVAVGHNDRLYYVNYDYFQVFRHKTDPEKDLLNITQYYELSKDKQDEYAYDETISQENYNDFKNELVCRMTKRYKSMTAKDRWLGRSQHAICSNALFHVALEDNEWSVAVELIATSDGSPNLQKRHISSYAKSLRNILLDMFPEIYIRTGAWTSSPLTQKDAKQLDKEENQKKHNLKKNRKDTENNVSCESIPS